MGMVELYAARNEVEVCVIKSLLDAHGVAYFVRNDHFGAIYSLPRFSLLNRPAFLVAAEDLELGREIVRDYLKDTGSEEPEINHPLGFWGWVRILIRAMMPGGSLPRSDRR